jgi:hypothetical protein
VAYRSVTKRRRWFRRRYRTRHEWESTRAAAYRRANRAEISLRQQNWYASKLEEDPSYRALTCLQSCWKSRLKQAGVARAPGFLRVLGCAWSTFRKRVEAELQEGWNWENYGSVWVCDHVQPFAAFQLHSAIERRMVSHYWNLRPLGVKENRIKNGNFDPDELQAYKRAFVEKFYPRRVLETADCPF